MISARPVRCVFSNRADNAPPVYSSSRGRDDIIGEQKQRSQDGRHRNSGTQMFHEQYATSHNADGRVVNASNSIGPSL